MATRSAKSRCVGGRPVRYQWAGEPLNRSPEHGETVSKVVVTWFADRAENQEFATGNIDSRHFNKYLIKLKAFLEEKLDRLQEGKLTPGSEVIEVERAVGQNIFELHWHFETVAQKKGKTQIRHYEAESDEVENSVFGLVLHVKDVAGNDTEIRKKQNTEIDAARELYSRHSGNGWKLN